ncbi:hypothetical protein NSTC731_06341 [Nostoc sp. DSM 114167]
MTIDLGQPSPVDVLFFLRNSLEIWGWESENAN